LKKSKFKLSTQTVAVVLLGVVLLSIVGMVVYESFKAGTKDKVATAQNPHRCEDDAGRPDSDAHRAPKTKYSLDQGLESIKAVYANGSGLSDQNRPYIEAAFYNTAAARILPSTRLTARIIGRRPVA